MFNKKIVKIRQSDYQLIYCINEYFVSQDRFSKTNNFLFIKKLSGVIF